MADRRLTDLELERWLAEDLPEARRQTATEADRGRLEELRAEHARLLAAVDVDAEVRAISRRMEQSTGRTGPAAAVSRRFAGWKWILSGGALAAAAAVAVLVLVRPGPGPDDDIQLKGDDVALVIYAATPTGSRRLASGDTVQPGDELRFDVVVPRAGHIAVLGIDGTGASTVYYPFGGQEPAAIDPRAGGVLPGAIALDAAAGDERFFAVYSARPFAIGDELFAALRAGRTPGDLATAEVVLHKKTSRF